MSNIIDGFGQVYMAYYRGEPSNHVTERDDGYRQELPDASIYFSPFEEWQDYEKNAIHEARGKVLDIGLGAGRHSLYLQEHGFQVVGIDNSPLAVEVSRLRGVKECLIMDLHNLKFPDISFNTVLMLGANLGLGDIDVVQSYLSRLYEITTPDGIIIGNTRDPLKTDNLRHLAYHEMNRRRGKPPGLVKVRICFQGKCGGWFDFLMIGEDLLAEIIKPTGWSIKKFYRSVNSDYITILNKR